MQSCSLAQIISKNKKINLKCLKQDHKNTNDKKSILEAGNFVEEQQLIQRNHLRTKPYFKT